jgi:3-dehydroquinate synthase
MVGYARSAPIAPVEAVVSHSTKTQRITVAFDVAVHFTEGVFDSGNTTLVDTLSRQEPGRRHRVLAVLDGGLVDANPELPGEVCRYFEAHGDRAALAASPMVVAGGEAVKNDERAVRDVLARLDELRIDRQSFVLAVGGGAVLDMAGYAAATAHRGVRLVRLPSTVLAQADSGIGVKNGINAFGKKNFLGTFAPPFAVINDVHFLATLSERDAIAGMSEAVKVALVRDALFFEWLRAHAGSLRARNSRSLAALVRHSAELHLRHIATSGDPFELGSARPLDFGHWAAHKLEGLTAYGLRHGEAVAIGIALDTLHSVKAGLCPPRLADSVLGTLERLGFSLWDEALAACTPAGRLRVLEGLEEFREHLGGELTVTLLRDAGVGVEVHEMDERLIVQAIGDLRERTARRTLVRPHPARAAG